VVEEGEGMSHLLRVIRFNTKSSQEGGKIPLMMEFSVNPSTGPYLVSSSASVLWVPEAHPGDVVRAAVRPEKSNAAIIGSFFLEVMDAVEAMGRHSEWGNTHPFTENGVQRAVEHVKFYDQGELCLLIPRIESSLPLKDIAMNLGCLPQPCSWVPGDCAIVVPKDRDFVGFLGVLGHKGLVAVVHNASRGMAIARGTPIRMADEPDPLQEMDKEHQEVEAAIDAELDEDREAYLLARDDG